MDINRTLTAISIAAIPVLLAVTVHEVAHGRVARRLGDPTAERQGRLSLNPLTHVDLFGTIIVPAVLLLIGSPFLFGWAKPVPVDPRYFKHPKGDMAWVAAAGPASNLLMAVGWTLLAGIAREGFIGNGILAQWLFRMSAVGLLANVFLAVFNMLPIPPLDGGRVLVGILPKGPAHALARVEPFGFLILLALLYSRVLGFIINPIADALTRLLSQLVP